MTNEEAKDKLDFLKTPLDEVYKSMIEALDMAIKALEQEPKTGHWIEHPHEAGLNWEYSKYECSECHYWAEDDSNYCPDCGAEMDIDKR